MGGGVKIEGMICVVKIGMVKIVAGTYERYR